MSAKQFEQNFEELTKEMLEIAFEFAGFNEKEIEQIYVLGSTEDNGFETNFFFRVNSVVVPKHAVNDHLELKVNLSREIQVEALKLQNEALIKLVAAFKTDEREVPTVLKITYEPPTKKFHCDLVYNKVIGKKGIDSFYDLYTTWLEKEKAALSK